MPLQLWLIGLTSAMLATCEAPSVDVSAQRSALSPAHVRCWLFDVIKGGPSMSSQ